MTLTYLSSKKKKKVKEKKNPQSTVIFRSCLSRISMTSCAEQKGLWAGLLMHKQRKSDRRSVDLRACGWFVMAPDRVARMELWWLEQRPCRGHGVDRYEICPGLTTRYPDPRSSTAVRQATECCCFRSRRSGVPRPRLCGTGTPVSGGRVSGIVGLQTGDWASFLSHTATTQPIWAPWAT